MRRARVRSSRLWELRPPTSNFGSRHSRIFRSSSVTVHKTLWDEHEEDNPQLLRLRPVPLTIFISHPLHTTISSRFTFHVLRFTSPERQDDFFGGKRYSLRRTSAAQQESNPAGCSYWFVLFIWFIWSVWFNQTNETNQITVFFCWRDFSASC